MTLAESVKASQRASIRSWLVWSAKMAPLLKSGQLEQEAAHFAEELRGRDEALAQLEAWAEENDRAAAAPGGER
jgi:hypothetical protein